MDNTLNSICFTDNLFNGWYVMKYSEFKKQLDNDPEIKKIRKKNAWKYKIMVLLTDNLIKGNISGGDYQKIDEILMESNEKN